MWRLVACTVLLGLTFSSPAPSEVTSDVTNTSLLLTGHNDRQGKAWLPFYVVVRFGNVQCTAKNNLLGTCYLTRECKSQAGVISGSCARRIGKCCVVTRTCGGTPSKSNNTYYRNPGFPKSTSAVNRCKISISKLKDSICQIRLTFTKLTLAQPDASGACITDYLTITGSDTQVPRICGENSGQHLYLRFMNDSSPIQISIVTGSASFNRTWDILVSQHECSEGAPLGCLQYYTGLTGSVSSFNYGPNNNNGQTRQLTSLRYGICVRPEAGYCGIEWSQPDLDTFTISGDTTTAENNNLLGDKTAMVKGGNCTTDFVIIPNAVQNLQAVNADRFCGNALLPTRSMSQMMVLTVVDNDGENGDVGNRGFQLTYRQIVCGP